MNETSDRDVIGDILANFPGPITLYPSFKEFAKFIAWGATFTGISVFFSLGGDKVMMVCLAFFGVATLVFVIMILPGASAVCLNENGFDLTYFYRTKTFRWSEVDDFSIVTFRRRSVVEFNAAALRHTVIGKIDAALGHRNWTLPSTYGLSADDLAELMTRWRKRALAART
jgi:hypothetical protein